MDQRAGTAGALRLRLPITTGGWTRAERTALGRAALKQRTAASGGADRQPCLTVHKQLGRGRATCVDRGWRATQYSSSSKHWAFAA